MKVGSKNELLASNESPIFKKMMKIPHLLLSLSIFSFLFSSYSSSFPIHSPNTYFHHYFFPYSAHPYYTPLPLLNKSFLFLICNALLVFLAKTSSDLALHPHGDTYTDDLHDALQRKIDFISLGLLQAAKLETPVEEFDTNEYLLEYKAAYEVEGGEQEEEKAVVISEEPKEAFVVDIAESEEERDADDDSSRRCWIFDSYQGINHEEINYEEEEDGEELNRRIEAFIKKMKEEIIHSEQEETPST